jgi:inhibitor of KinA sporulation pathway (predicted exonuclease)
MNSVSNATVTRANQEIIEFPWVVIDVAARKIVDSEQMFVKPEWMPQLTAFCIKRTGITQDKVDNAPSLSTALTTFDAYLKEQFDEKKKTYALVTDGEWDLKVCLRSEAMKKKLVQATQQHYLKYFDIKRTFVGLYRLRWVGYSLLSVNMDSCNGWAMFYRGSNANGMLQENNIASIVLRIINDGYPFSVGGLTIIPPTYDPNDDLTIRDYAVVPRVY